MYYSFEEFDGCMKYGVKCNKNNCYVCTNNHNHNYHQDTHTHKHDNNNMKYQEYTTNAKTPKNIYYHRHHSE